MVPRPVRSHCARLLRPDRRPCRQLPVHGRGARVVMGKPMPGWTPDIFYQERQSVVPGECGDILHAGRSEIRLPAGYWQRPKDKLCPGFGGERVQHEGRRRPGTRTAIRGPRSSRRRHHFWPATGSGLFQVESACLEHAAGPEAGGLCVTRRAARQHRQSVHRSRGADNPSDELAEEIKRFVLEPASPAYAYPRDRIRQRPPEDTDRQDPSY